MSDSDELEQWRKWGAVRANLEHGNHGFTDNQMRHEIDRSVRALAEEHEYLRKKNLRRNRDDVAQGLVL